MVVDVHFSHLHMDTMHALGPLGIDLYLLFWKRLESKSLSLLKCHESSTLRPAYQRYGLAPSKLLPAKKKVTSPAPDRSIPFNHQKNRVCVGTFLFPPGHFAGSSSFVDRSLFVFFCQRPLLLFRKAAVLPVKFCWTPAGPCTQSKISRSKSLVVRFSKVLLKGSAGQVIFWNSISKTTDRWLRHGEPSTRLMPWSQVWPYSGSTRLMDACGMTLASISVWLEMGNEWKVLLQHNYITNQVSSTNT